MAGASRRHGPQHVQLFIIVTAREALPSHPSPDVNSLADLEKVLRVRLQTGAPGPSGQVDPDGVGILPWQTCVYAAGETPVEALKFIHFILSHKVHHGILPTMPELSVDVIGGNLRNLPEPWVLNEMPVVDPAPKPFSVVPARGKRHVLAQLEQKAVEGEDSQAREEEQDDEEQQADRATFSPSLEGFTLSVLDLMRIPLPGPM